MKEIISLLEGMSLQEQRAWYIRMLIKNARLSIAVVAARHRISTYGLAGAISGIFPWGPRVIKALEKEFGICLTAYLTEKEAAKMDRA